MGAVLVFGLMRAISSAESVKRRSARQAVAASVRKNAKLAC